jgi:hypothetical protein
MPVPPECQQYVDAAAALRAQVNSLVETAAAQEPAQKWSTLQATGSLRAQIADQERLLSECVSAHADFSVDVAVFDLRGANQPNPSRVVRVWQLDDVGAQGQPLEAPVTGSVSRFATRPTPVSQFIGLAVHDTSTPQPSVTFQSPALFEIPTLQNDANRSRIEIVLPSALSLDLNRFSKLTPSRPVTAAINTPTGQVTAIVEHADLRLNANALECSAALRLKHAMGEAAGVPDRPPMSGPGSMLVQGWSGRHG